MERRKKIKIPAYGRCALCGETKILTGEHMIAAWIGRATNETAPLSRNTLTIPHLNLNSVTVERHVGGNANAKIPVLCETCNHEFSSKLQESVIGILTPFLNGEWLAMTEDHRLKLARWFVCFAMIRQFLHPETITFTRNERQLFRATSEIPEGTEFWAWPVINDENVSKTWHRVVFRRDNIANKIFSDTYLINCYVGKVFFVGFGSSNDELKNENSIPHYALTKMLRLAGARQIWPAHSKFTAHKPRKEMTPESAEFVIPFLTHVIANPIDFLGKFPDDFVINEQAMRTYGL